MTEQPRPSRAIHITLWVVQILLAASLIWAASLKLFQAPEKLALMWPWAGQVPNALVKFTGVVDLCGGLGLLLPMLLNVKPRLTYFAALGIVVLMVVASVFHISRGEGAQIVPNIVFLLMAGFVAWGRRENGR